MKRFISFSGGVESTTMCLIWGGSVDGAIFADTGFEHEALYRRLETVEKKIAVLHPTFRIFRIQADESLTDYIRRSKFYPSPHSRFCTDKFKIKPIDNFLRQYDREGVELFIGLNADETDRTGNHGLLKFVNYRYPLIENGLNRQACERLLDQAGLHPHFPVYMQRGGCKGCFFKRKTEFRAMLHLSREEYLEVERLEAEIQDRRGEFYRIKNDMPSLREFRLNEEGQFDLFDPAELYESLPGQSCGAFCHR